MTAMDDVMICYVLQRTRRPLFRSISVYISGTVCARECMCVCVCMYACMCMYTIAINFLDFYVIALFL